jgi:hypothetical protein
MGGGKSQGGLDAKTYWLTVSRNVTSDLSPRSQMGAWYQDRLDFDFARIWQISNMYQYKSKSKLKLLYDWRSVS